MCCKLFFARFLSAIGIRKLKRTESEIRASEENTELILQRLREQGIAPKGRPARPFRPAQANGGGDVKSGRPVKPVQGGSGGVKTGTGTSRP